ncbi:MAG: sulfotransferase domain-containing protein [Singulisphaera sp.]
MRRPWMASLWQWNRNHILIACFPKSGSTYLSKVLQDLTGYPNWYAAEPGEQNEQDLSERRLVRPRRPAVLQQHLKATRSNLELMVFYRMRPIVQTRNLFDTIVSLHDHFQHMPTGLPCGFVSDQYVRMPWRERVDYLIHLHLPWYFNFALSWREASRRLEICTVSYESLFAHQEEELSRITSFCGFRFSRAQIVQAMARVQGADTRFNVGTSGRGAELLSYEHKQAIRRLADACSVAIDHAGNLAPFVAARPTAARRIERSAF